jgi:single-stranded DNA-binding protein
MSGIEVAFFGVAGTDGDVRTSQKGKQYLRVNIRVGDGEGAQWISVTAFDQTAVEMGDKILKGARLYVEGRLTLDQWTAKDGAARHGLSVFAWHCRLAGIGRNKPKRERSDNPKPATPAQSDAVGFYDDPIPPL